MECALTSPVRTEFGMLVICSMQCCMSLSTVSWCGDVVSRGGMYKFVMVKCLVLLMCTFIICSSVFCVLIVEGMLVVVNAMLSLMRVMSPPPDLCVLSVRTTVYLGIFGVFALGVSFVS